MIDNAIRAGIVKGVDAVSWRDWIKRILLYLHDDLGIAKARAVIQANYEASYISSPLPSSWSKWILCWCCILINIIHFSVSRYAFYLIQKGENGYILGVSALINIQYQYKAVLILTLILNIDSILIQYSILNIVHSWHGVLFESRLW